MKLFKATSFASLAAALLSFGIPVNALERAYEYEVDRFDGTKSASYATASGCRQTKGLKVSADTCLFINSTESGRYPRLSVMKTNDGWELLSYRQDTAPVIVTYANGTTKKLSLPTNLTTKTLYGGTVAEWVAIETKAIPNQSQIKMIEWQYGSAEFEFKPDKRFSCVARLVASC